MQSLASLDGVGYTRASLNNARDAAHQTYESILRGLRLPPATMGCHARARVRQDLLNSTDYGRAVLGSQRKKWQTDVPGVCKAEECLDHGPSSTERDLAQDVVAKILTTSVPCNSGCKCTTNLSPNVCAWMQDTVDAGPVLQASDYVDLTVLQSLYDPRDDGCSTYPSCSQGAECECVFKDELQPEELTAAVPTLKPSTPPWVVFYESTAPTSIPDTGLAIGDDWVALDACRAPAAGARCNLATEPAPDKCNGDNPTAKALQELYCGPSARFQSTNPQNSQCLPTGCLGGASIASRRAVVPSGIKATVFSAPPVTCYRLSCPNADNGRVVMDPGSYTGTKYTDTRLGVVVFTYGSAIARLMSVGVQMTSNGARMLESYVTCFPGLTDQSGTNHCRLNALRTRPMSALYGNRFTTTFSYADESHPASLNMELAASIVRETEDRYATMGEDGRGCMQDIPTNLPYCNVSSAFGSNSLRSAQPCSDAQIQSVCARLAADMCSQKSREPHCYCIQNTRSCSKELSVCPSDWPSDYTDCMVPFVGGMMVASYNQLRWVDPLGPAHCVAQFGAVCRSYVYQRTETTSPCTADALTCPFNAVQPGQPATWEDTYQDLGLPREGFCPACTLSDGSCDVVKSSTTYATAREKVRMHGLAGVQVRTGGLTGANAVHLRLEGDGGAQCGTPTCGANQKPVQFLRDVWTCVDCVAAPLTQCEGKHMCRFSNNTLFPEALARVKAQIQAATPPIPVPPVPLAWGARNNFSGFNPTVLNAGFNTAITGLQGKCKSDQALPSFSECQNDAPRRTLRSHVQSQYTIAEGARIPSLATLTWAADYAQLTGTNIPAWEAARETPFLDALLDDSVCRRANFNQLVCFQQSGTVRFFNPSTAGDFEVQEGCDTVVEDSTRFIDSQCNRLVCPLNSDTVDTYNMFQGSDPSTNWMQCRTRDRQLPAYYSTPSSVPTNLCGRTPSTPRACAGKQGTLDGDGAPGDLYGADLPPAMPSSVLDGTLGATKNLSLSPWDIGGHYIRMRVGGAKLKVTGLPLRAADLASAAAMNATDWVKAWKKASAAERQAFANEHTDPACETWACPLRRWHFWTGSHPTFRPWSPSPTRTEPFYSSPTHPTTAPARLRNGVLGAYRTWDGVCAFPAGTQRPASGACSEAEVARALADGQQRESKVYGSCAKQADWPFVGGQLRDGATLKQNVSACGVLDRIPPFRFRSHSSETPPSPAL